MKRILLFVCILIISISLFACGKKPNNDSENNNGENQDRPKINYPFPCDYEISVEGKDKITILQLTDPQIHQKGDDWLYDRAYKYMDFAVEQTNPDLILLTGDIIYGRYDDDGELLKNIVSKMESYGVPWAPVFGNHDNESKKGTEWQCLQFLLAENCLFKIRNELSGNGNYSIGLKLNGELVHTIYMIDTKGCAMVDGVKNQVSSYGISTEQIDFIKEGQENAALYAGKAVKGFVGLHVMPAVITAPIAVKYNHNLKDGIKFTIPENDYGDFGEFGQGFAKTVDTSGDAFDGFLESDIDGVFCGHYHENNASVMYEGIRLTFGLKSSTCDSHDINKLGGTRIEVMKDSFTVEHVYYK